MKHKHCDYIRSDAPECLRRGHMEIEPGVYKCPEGHRHINGPEYCRAHGIEPTMENMLALAKQFDEESRRKGGGGFEVLP